MKPTKNRVFCRACSKTKMLFESQAKADNFIKFNGDEILEESGKKPSRSYYCELCGGYHVTSIDSEVVGERIDMLVKSKVDSYKKQKKQLKERKQETIAESRYLTEKAKKAREAMCFERMDDVYDAIELFELELERLSLTDERYRSRWTKKLNSLKAQISSVCELLTLSDDEQKSYVTSESHKQPAKILKSILAVRRAKEILLEAERLFEIFDVAKANQMIEECRRFVNLIDSPWKDYIKKEIASQIVLLENNHSLSDVSIDN